MKSDKHTLQMDTTVWKQVSWGMWRLASEACKKLDCTCQQKPVLGNPLNWLEQIVLEGQTSTAGAHLKETPKINNNSTAVKGWAKENMPPNNYWLYWISFLSLKSDTATVLSTTLQSKHFHVEDIMQNYPCMKDTSKHSYSVDSKQVLWPRRKRGKVSQK